MSGGVPLVVRSFNSCFGNVRDLRKNIGLYIQSLVGWFREFRKIRFVKQSLELDVFWHNSMLMMERKCLAWNWSSNRALRTFLFLVVNVDVYALGWHVGIWIALALNSSVLSLVELVGLSFVNSSSSFSNSLIEFVLRGLCIRISFSL